MIDIAIRICVKTHHATDRGRRSTASPAEAVRGTVDP